jgi:hypothetical protein
LAEADAVVVTSGDVWQVVADRGGKLTAIAGAPKPDQADAAGTAGAAAMHDWLLRTFGVTDKVLKRRGSAAVALAPGRKVGTQGVVVGNGAAAIVEVVGRQDRFALIKFVLGSDPAASLPEGAKILWESEAH